MVARKIIIDTDCGVDDAVALLIALELHNKKGSFQYLVLYLFRD